MQNKTRIKRELEMFQQSPPHGISCWSKQDSLTQLEAQIIGGDGTPYEGGIFKLEIELSERYPFEPPKIRFVTPIYHPNIDNAGRICLDSLKMPPKGAWKPSLNLSTLLTTIQLLMSEPNPDDPLMTDIANEFKFNRCQYHTAAKAWTKKHAIPDKPKVLDELSSKSERDKESSDSESSDGSDTENVLESSKKIKTPLAMKRPSSDSSDGTESENVGDGLKRAKSGQASKLSTVPLKDSTQFLS